MKTNALARLAIWSLVLVSATATITPGPSAAPYEPIPFRKQSAPKPKAVRTPTVTTPKHHHTAPHSPAPTVTVPPHV